MLKGFKLLPGFRLPFREEATMCATVFITIMLIAACAS
jgi:hypothetical protein